MTEVIKQYPDGIYFNMPFKEYIAQDRHSNSRIKKVNDSPLKFWVDEIEPTLAPDFNLDAKLEDDTEAMAEGKAWHVMALEGAEAFNALYTSDYNPADYPKAIKSKDDHVEACEKNGVDFKKSDTIAALQKALIAAGSKVQFHSVLKAQHEAANASKILLSPTAMNELQIAGAIMAQYKIHEDFLSNGFPEVSILFTMDGERYKIRVDWLAVKKQVEFKTITVSGQNTKTFEENCADQMHKFSYMPAGYLYTCGVEIARAAVRDIMDGKKRDFFIDSGEVGDDWFSEFASCAKPEYWFLFQQRGKYNHVLPRRFDKYDEVIQHRKIQRIWKTGKIDVEHGVKLYNYFMENFGKENRWLPDLNAKPWADEDFKPWMIEE